MLNPETIAAKLSAQPFPLLKRAIHWSAASGRFNFILFVMSDGEHCVQMNTRDAFDENLAADALRFTAKHESKILKATTWCLLDGFHHDGYDFDSVVAVAPSAQQIHEADDPQLQAVTYEIYPAFRCEVAGNETVKEIVARDKMIDPANIHREAQPFLRLRYLNTRTRGRSLGDKRGIDTSGMLFGQLRKLVGAPQSFVEFENYLGDVARAEWDETRGYVLEWKDDRWPMTDQDLIVWVKNFICPADR